MQKHSPPISAEVIAKSQKVVPQMEGKILDQKGKRHIFQKNPFHISLAVVEIEITMSSGGPSTPVINDGSRDIKALETGELSPET